LMLPRYMMVLGSLGVNVASNAVYDFLKTSFSGKNTSSRAEFERELGSFLKVHGANVQASTVVDMFAAQGLLSVQGSTIYAPQQITMGAAPGAQFSFGNDSTSSTDRTKVETPGNARISGSNAAMRQNPDGSISFLVGSNESDHISFGTGGNQIDSIIFSTRDEEKED